MINSLFRIDQIEKKTTPTITPTSTTQTPTFPTSILLSTMQSVSPTESKKTIFDKDTILDVQ